MEDVKEKTNMYRKEETVHQERVQSKKEEPGEMFRAGDTSVTEGFKAESTKMKEMVIGDESERKNAATFQCDSAKQTSQERNFSDSPSTNVEITGSVDGTKKHEEEAKTRISHETEEQVLENMSHKNNEEIQPTVSEGQKTEIQKERGDSLKQEGVKRTAQGSDVPEEDSSEKVFKKIRQASKQKEQAVEQEQQEVKPVDHLSTKICKSTSQLSASSLSEVGTLFKDRPIKETAETKPCTQTSMAPEGEYVETLPETQSISDHTPQKPVLSDRNIRDVDNKVKQQQTVVEDDEQLQASLEKHTKEKTKPGQEPTCFKSKSDGVPEQTVQGSYTAEQYTLKDKDEDIHPFRPKQPDDKQFIVSCTEEVKTQQHTTEGTSAFLVSQKMSKKSLTEQDALRTKMTKTEKDSAKTEEISGQEGRLTSRDQMFKSEAREAHQRVLLEEKKQRVVRSVQKTDAESAEKEQSERKAGSGPTPEPGSEETTREMPSPVIEVVATQPAEHLPEQVIEANKTESEEISPETDKTSTKKQLILAADKSATDRQKKPAINKQVTRKGLDPTVINKTAEINSAESQSVSPPDPHRKESRPQQTAVEPDQLKVSTVKGQTFKVFPLKDTQTTQASIDEISSEEVSQKHAEMKCSEVATGVEVVHVSEGQESTSRQERGPKFNKHKQITPKFETATNKTETTSPVKDGATEKHPEYPESVTKHAALDDDINTTKLASASPREPQHQLTEVGPDQQKVNTVTTQSFKVSPLTEKKSKQEQMKRKALVTPVKVETNKETGSAAEKLELAAGNEVWVSGGTPPLESLSQKERQYKLAETQKAADERIPLKPITAWGELNEDSEKEKVIKDEESRAKAFPFKSKTDKVASVYQQKTRQDQNKTKAEGIPEMEGKEKRLEDNSQEKGNALKSAETLRSEVPPTTKHSVAPVMDVTSETSGAFLSDTSRCSSVKLGKENIVEDTPEKVEFNRKISGAAKTNKSHGPTSNQVIVMEESTNILSPRDSTKQTPLETETTLSPDRERAKTVGVKERDSPSETVENKKNQSEVKQNSDQTSHIKCEDDQNVKKFKSQKEKQDMLGKSEKTSHKAVLSKAVKYQYGRFTPLEEIESKQEEMEFSLAPVMETASERSLSVNIGNVKSDSLQNIITPDKLIKGFTSREVNSQSFNDFSQHQTDESPDDTKEDAPVKALRTKFNKVQDKTEKLAERQEHIERRASAQPSVVDTHKELKVVSKTTRGLTAEESKARQKQSETHRSGTEVTHTERSKVQNATPPDRTETKQEQVEPTRSLVSVIEVKDGQATADTLQNIVLPDKSVKGVTPRKGQVSETGKVFPPRHSQTTDKVKKVQHELKPTTQSQLKPEEEVGQDAETVTGPQRLMTFDGHITAEHKTRAESKSDDLLRDKEKCGLIKEEVGGTLTKSHLSDKSAVGVGEFTGKDMAVTVSPPEGTNKLKHNDSKAGETPETEEASIGDNILDRHTKRNLITLTGEAMLQEETKGQCLEMSQKIVDEGMISKKYKPESKAGIERHKLTAKEPSVTDRTKLTMTKTSTTDDNKTDAPEWTDHDPRTGKSVLQPFLKADVRFIPPQEVQTLFKPEGEAQGLHPILETRFFSVEPERKEHGGPQESSRGIKGGCCMSLSTCFGSEH